MGFMTESLVGYFGAILGSLLGVAGGVFGTWLAIRNSPPGKTRAFLKKISLVCWFGTIAFVVAVCVLPSPWNWLVWIPYPVVLLGLIRYINRSMAKLHGQQTE